MIAKIVLTSVLTMFLSGGIYTKITEEQHETATTSQSAVSVSDQDDITKAIVFNGEVIPWIELPVVEITADRNLNTLVKATIVDGKISPSIDLEEVVIIPGA